MSDKNVFSSLYHWAYRQGENFTTDAFVYVVNQLINRNSDLARSFLGWLCFNDENCAAFARAWPPCIQPHHRGETGIPDIWFETREVLVLVEVKTASNLQKGQLRQYHQILKDDGRRGQLVLLTAFHADCAPDEEPHLRRRWADVEQWFNDHRIAVADAVLSFLVEQFLTFLRSEVMPANHVEWQYVEGVKSLVNLTAMLEEACKTTKLTVTKTPAFNYAGFNLPDGLWTGVYFDNPDVVVFEYTKQDLGVANCFGQLAGWGKRPNNGHWATTLDLSDATTHFFALDKYGQQTCLVDFVARANREAQKCLSSSAPTTP